MTTCPVSVVPDFCIEDLVRHAYGSPLGGAIVEVGVYKGGTAWRLAEVARARGVKLYLYDTFTGIPYKDDIDTHRPGDFNDTSADAVRAAIPDAVVIEGIFPGTMVDMGLISFVHIDCDQYRAIVESVRALAPSMVDGGVMVFDDFGCLDGATKAVTDLFVPGSVMITPVGKAIVKFRGGEDVLVR